MTPAHRRLDQTRALDKFQHLDLLAPRAQQQATGAFHTAIAGTTFFGGTVLAADSARKKLVMIRQGGN